jgi:glycosyltransferase involved in cell wall biosynthesis
MPGGSKSKLVSVIVPTYQSAAFLEECLRSIREQVWKDVELVVVDNGSTDGTTEIARKYTQHVHQKGPERCAQRNFGVQVSAGDLVLMIDSDMVLSPRVIEACVAKMRSRPELKALVIPERSFGQGFWADCKALERSFYVGVDWMEGARLFRRDVYEELGGYDESFVGGEDWDLPQRLEQKYGASSIGRIDEVILHDEQHLSLLKTCRKKFYYAQTLDNYRDKPANRGKFARQGSPLARYRLFLERPARLLENPVTSAGMLVLKTCEFAAGAAGYVYGRTRQG